MIFHPGQLYEANKALFNILESGKFVEINDFVKTRSNLQNRALHLYFTECATQFNELGFTFNYHDPFTGHIIEMTWTGEMIKEYIWRPIQLTLFDKKSTTKLTTSEINEIVEILSKHFAENGSQVHFPNWQIFLNKIDLKNILNRKL